MVNKCVQELKIDDEEKKDEAPKSPRKQQGKKHRPAWKIDRCSPHKSKNSRRARRNENSKLIYIMCSKYVD